MVITLSGAEFPPSWFRQEPKVAMDVLCPAALQMIVQNCGGEISGGYDDPFSIKN